MDSGDKGGGVCGGDNRRDRGSLTDWRIAWHILASKRMNGGT
jgi:hypothetical protein